MYLFFHALKHTHIYMQIDWLQVVAELQLCLKLIHIFSELSCSEGEA